MDESTKLKREKNVYTQHENAEWVFSHNFRCPHCRKFLCISVDGVKIR